MTNRKEQKYESGVPHVTRQTDLNSVMTLWDKIDISPKEIQRQFVADKDKDWMPDFIADIFCGEDLGVVVISLQNKIYKVEWKGSEKTVQYKLLDGQQRLTMLWLFTHDEVLVQEGTMIFDDNKRACDIGNMLWSDIKRKFPTVADKFLSRGVLIKEYGEKDNVLKPREESKIFKTIQAGFKLERQEVRQCSSALIAHQTREDVRLNPIPLYKGLIKIDNTRMKLEEGRAIHIHYLINNMRAITPNSLDEMYDDINLEEHEDKCKIYSVLYGKSIRVFKELKSIEDMMTKILKDKQFYSAIGMQYYHSLFFFCSLLIQHGLSLDDTDELKWNFFRNHVKLVQLVKDENGEMGESKFAHALSTIGTKKELKYVVDTWTKQLGL